MLQNNEKWIQISVAETIMYHLEKDKLVCIAYTAPPKINSTWIT